MTKKHKEPKKTLEYAGTSEGFSWEIILGYRQNWGANLVQREGYIEASAGYADVWVNQKDSIEHSHQKTVNEKYLAVELPKAKLAYEQAVANART